MTAYLNPPLQPRDGKALRVLAIARISTLNQDERSNDDQVALVKAWVVEHFSGAVHWTVISGQGSGEYLDRQELFDAEAAVATNTLDLVVVEDLARICRRNRAFDFCELCEDHGVRLIAINDHIDTARDDWHLNAFFATFRHQLYNKDTSARIRRTLRNRFTQGGVFQCQIYGYIKPDDAKSDADVRKDPDAEEIYDQWFQKLEDGASYSEVADWLNAKGIKPGPYCRDKRWTGRMVMRVTFNPILKGQRRRNVKESRRINKTGRRRSINAAPELLLTRDCSHLRFIGPERYDRVIRLLRKKNEGYARGRRRTAADSRNGVSKKATVWPGQHILCGICNRPFYWGGHGQKEHMMCSGCRDYRCWNAATFDGFDAGRRLTQAILTEIQSLKDFDATFREKVKLAVETRHSTRNRELNSVGKALDNVLHQVDNLTDAIAVTGINDVLRAKLTTLITRRDDLQVQITDLKREPEETTVLPTMDEIKCHAREIIMSLPSDGPEFGRLMRRLIPSLKVLPFRLCDDGALVLRAELALNLTVLTKLNGLGDDEIDVLRRRLTVDLFDPPERAKFRERVIALRASGMTEAQAAKTLGITVTAAQRAAALHRLMEAQNLNSPYVAVTELPADCGKLRRHLHRRYRFEPLDGSSPT